MHLAAVLQYAMTLVTAAQRNPTSRWGSFFTIGSPAFTAARILVPPGEVMPICACVGATGLAWLPHPPDDGARRGHHRCGGMASTDDEAPARSVVDMWGPRAATPNVATDETTLTGVRSSGRDFWFSTTLIGTNLPAKLSPSSFSVCGLAITDCLVAAAKSSNPLPARKATRSQPRLRSTATYRRW